MPRLSGIGCSDGVVASLSAKLGVEQINPDAVTFLVLAGLATGA
jgi:hypothetical protein